MRLFTQPAWAKYKQDLTNAVSETKTKIAPLWNEARPLTLSRVKSSVCNIGHASYFMQKKKNLSTDKHRRHPSIN
jgi:hypothetical protein